MEQVILFSKIKELNVYLGESVLNKQVVSKTVSQVLELRETIRKAEEKIRNVVFKTGVRYFYRLAKESLLSELVFEETESLIECCSGGTSEDTQSLIKLLLSLTGDFPVLGAKLMYTTVSLSYTAIKKAVMPGIVSRLTNTVLKTGISQATPWILKIILEFTKLNLELKEEQPLNSYLEHLFKYLVKNQSKWVNKPRIKKEIKAFFCISSSLRLISRIDSTEGATETLSAAVEAEIAQESLLQFNVSVVNTLLTKSIFSLEKKIDMISLVSGVTLEESDELISKLVLVDRPILEYGDFDLNCSVSNILEDFSSITVFKAKYREVLNIIKKSEATTNKAIRKATSIICELNNEIEERHLPIRLHALSNHLLQYLLVSSVKTPSKSRKIKQICFFFIENSELFSSFDLIKCLVCLISAVNWDNLNKNEKNTVFLYALRNVTSPLKLVSKCALSVLRLLNDSVEDLVKNKFHYILNKANPSGWDYKQSIELLNSSLKIISSDQMNLELLEYQNTLNSALEEAIYVKDNQRLFILLSLALEIALFLGKSTKSDKHAVNSIRVLILTLLPCFSHSIPKIRVKSLLVYQNYLNLLQNNPLEKEEAVNYSEEDGDNVSIPNALGPILAVTWDHILFNLAQTSILTVKTTLTFLSCLSSVNPDLLRKERLDAFVSTTTATFLSLLVEFNSDQLNQCLCLFSALLSKHKVDTPKELSSYI